MTPNAYKIVVVILALVQLVLSQIIGDSTVFGLGPVVVKSLGIVSAALTLLANYLPSLFGEAPVKPAG